MDATQPAAKVTRKVLITDPEAVFSMQQQQVEALGGMMAGDSARIDTLFENVGAMKGTVEVVHSKVNAVAAGVDKLTDAMAVLVKHEVLMEANAAEVRSMRETQSKHADRLHVLETKAPGWDEARAWMLRAMMGVIGAVGLAGLALILAKQAG